MSDTIFLLNDTGQLEELKEAAHLSEDVFQTLLANYPSLISGSQINPEKPRRWLLVSREFGVPGEKDTLGRWSLDHLFIDQDGIPTLVKVKRASDTRLRREVVGQILDYAANAVSYWSIEEIKLRFEQTCNSQSADAETRLMEFLEHEADIESFWETVKTNLKAGKVRLLIVADIIPKELQRIIEFLNEQMTPAEILGVEIKQFAGQNLKTLVPRVIGMTSNAQITKGQQRAEERQWDEESFFEEIRKVKGEQDAQTVRIIFEHYRPKVNRMVFGGKPHGKVYPVLDIVLINGKKENFWPFMVGTDGNVEIQFQWMLPRAPFNDEQMRLELLRRLNEIGGVSIDVSKITKRPNFPISLLRKETELQKFLDAMDWYFEETDKANRAL